MKKIKLTKGKYAIVDDDDFDFISQRPWCFHNQGYAVSNKIINGTQRTFWMHRIINKTPKGKPTDHINGNKLDNRKENLRTCSCSENRQNRKISKDNTSGFKGVHVSKLKYKNKMYRYIIANICAGGKIKYLGSFSNLKDAAIAYNKAATKLHGKFARLNPIL